MTPKTIECWKCRAKFSWEPRDAFGHEPRNCPACTKAEVEEKQRQRSAKVLAEREEVLKKICPWSFANTDVKRLGFEHGEQYRKVMAWTSDQRKGLVLIGETDKGKTRCLWELVKRLVREGVVVRFLRETDFSHEVGRRGKDGTLWDWVDKLCEVDVLAYDDLGKAPKTDRFISELFHVIDTRLNWGRPTLITTQLTGKEVGEQIKSTAGIHAGKATAEALVRRLRQHCQDVSFN